MTTFQEVLELNNPRRLEDIFTDKDSLAVAHEIMEKLTFQGVTIAGRLVNNELGYEVLNQLRRYTLISSEADVGNHGGEIKPFTAVAVLDSVKNFYLNEYYKNDIRR